jgi:hypothetical protein
MATAQPIPVNWNSPERAEPQPAKTADWRLAHRIAFRFGFVYLVLYNLVTMASTSIGLIPKVSKLVDWYNGMWKAIVPWVGKHVLHLSKDIVSLQTLQY